VARDASDRAVHDRRLESSVLRIAVVGCGWAARSLHAPGIRRSRCGEIVAVSDPRAGATAAFPAARQFKDWQTMLAEVACDAVLVASPPAQHAEVAVAALAMGRHVLVEKPLAVRLEDAERIDAAARSAGRVVAVGFNQRCHPRLLAIRAALARGEFGTLQSIHLTWHSGAGLGARDWLGERAQGGGALLDLGSHVVDLWRFLAQDEIGSIRAQSHSRIIDDESATLTATMLRGAVMTAELSLVAADRFEIVIRGSRRQVTVHPYGRDFRASYVAQWRAFADAIGGIGSPAAGVADGLASLAAIHRAAERLPTRARATMPAIAFPLSAIAATTRDYSALRTTVAHLRRQTMAARMELILVGPSEAALACPDAEIAGFASVVRLGIGAVTSIAQGNAAGVRCARGRVVALTEDHCFAEPEWAQALVDAHEGSCSVVGPVVTNANPRTRVSDADFVIGYGPWMAPMAAADMPFLPGHNSSYKRDELLALGGRLDRLLEAETVLHMEWSAQGRTLRVAPKARVRHVNYSRWRSWLPVQVLAGRLFGGARAATWPRRRRLFYAAASPLIPFVRFYRIARAFALPGRSWWRLARMTPALATGLVLDGAGQALGYLFGPGDAMERLAHYEFNRIDHVRDDERGLWISP
jgi:predicted dehydrogenase